MKIIGNLFYPTLINERVRRAPGRLYKRTGIEWTSLVITNIR